MWSIRDAAAIFGTPKDRFRHGLMRWSVAFVEDYQCLGYDHQLSRYNTWLYGRMAAGNSSALFLTAAAQNLLCLKLAESLGVIVSNPWITWFKAASVPAIAGLLATPLILYKLSPPEIKDTPDAPAIAEKKLQAMGPVTKNEWVMMATMLLAVALWVCGDKIGIPSVVAAMLGLSVLLVLGVLDWDDCLSEKSAWDTLAWFAVLVGMAGQLTSLGIVQWMSDSVAKALFSFSLSWPAALGILQASYFLIHYLFASQTGHVGALYSAFLAMHIAAGVPGVLAALALAYNTNLFGALTHYSSGQAAVYYGAGYVELPEIFKTGFLFILMRTWILSAEAGSRVNNNCKQGPSDLRVRVVDMSIMEINK
ncbi:hypothetical protein L7F22_051833 [Adiantum nelumboides]|nr:hypothetical protein [Adiantum nelumboides]